LFSAGIVCLVILSTAMSADVAADDTQTGHRKNSETVLIESAIVKLIDSVQVPTELPGVISELRYREGQMVKVGEVIARIKCNDLSLKLQRAEIEDRIARSAAENDIDVRFAEKSLEVSSAKVARSIDSNQRVPGVVPLGRIEEEQLVAHRDRLRVEQASRDLKVAEMHAELARTDVQLSTLLLEKASILAPIDGMVVAVEHKPGEWVEPGETIVKIVRMDRLKIEGFVPASIANQIRIGDPATAVVDQPWLQDTEFAGKVLFINPEANPVNSKVQVWVEVENSGLRLIPGLEAVLTITCAGE
jgi:macrolide-specific efflux system membrane fusion protein